MHSSKQKNNLLFYLLVFAGLFLAWELIIIIPANEFHPSTNYMLLFGKSGVAIPWRVWTQIVVNYLIVFAIHVVWVLLVWLVAKLIALLFKLNSKQFCILGITILVLTTMWLVLCNRVYFPSSALSLVMSFFLPLQLCKILIYLLDSFFILLALLVSVQVFRYLIRLRKFRFTAIGIILMMPLGYHFYHVTTNVPVTNPVSEKPNVIIIGIDDVVPGHLHIFGNQKIATPNLDAFFAQATTFSGSLTPLARTFVAWGSILTGQFPVHNRIRENFQELHGQDFQDSLSETLNRAGYQTIFATDDPSDSAMASLGQYFKFARCYTPPIGLGYVLSALLDDLPICNVLTKFKLGSWLFPSSYGNRFAAITYDPDAFTQQVKQEVLQRGNKPLFLAVHLCLPHWPNIWAGSPPESTYKSLLDAYDATIARADLQFRDLINFLQQQQLLNNAMVIVLSDHGESFLLPSDRMIKISSYVKGRQTHPNLFAVINHNKNSDNSVFTSNGHGSDILSYTQYNNLLGIRIYGKQKNQVRNIPTTVSLVDLKSTIFDFLNLPIAKTDGISLNPYILHKNLFPPERMLFIETAFTPKAMINGTRIDVNNVVYEAVNYYYVDPKSAYIFIRPEVLPKLISEKERAVYYQDWVLAVYPDDKTGLPILVNRKTSQWTDDLTVPFASQSPLQKMQQAFSKEYQNDPGFNLTN